MYVPKSVKNKYIMFMRFVLSIPRSNRKYWKKKYYYCRWHSQRSNYVSLKIKFGSNPVEIEQEYFVLFVSRERDDLFDGERLDTTLYKERYTYYKRTYIGIGRRDKDCGSFGSAPYSPSSSNFLFLRCRDRVEDRRVTGSGGQIKIHVPLASTVLINSEDRRDRPC